MNYHDITKCDMKNGDGMRVVLWVSGKRINNYVTTQIIDYCITIQMLICPLLRTDFLRTGIFKNPFLCFNHIVHRITFLKNKCHTSMVIVKKCVGIDNESAL